MHKKKGQTYKPSEDGFVFTEAEIAQAYQARNREWRTLKARRYAAA
jgi:hypothetical protein